MISTILLLILLFIILLLLLKRIKYVYLNITKENKYNIYYYFIILIILSITKLYINFFVLSFGINLTYINTILGGIHPLIIYKILRGCSGKDTSFVYSDIMILFIGITISYIYLSYIHSLCDIYLYIFTSTIAKQGWIDIIYFNQRLSRNLGITKHNYVYNENKIIMGPINNIEISNVDKKLINKNILSMDTIQPGEERGTESISKLEQSKTSSYKNPNEALEDKYTDNKTYNKTNTESRRNFLSQIFLKQNSIFYNLFYGDAIYPKKGFLLHKDNFFNEFIPSKNLDESINNNKKYLANFEDPEFKNSLHTSKSNIPKLINDYEKNLIELKRVDNKYNEMLTRLSTEGNNVEQTDIDDIMSDKKRIVNRLDITNVNIKNIYTCNILLSRLDVTGKRYYMNERFSQEEIKFICDHMEETKRILGTLNLNELRRKNQSLLPEYTFRSKAQILDTIEKAKKNIAENEPMLPSTLNAAFIWNRKIQELDMWNSLIEIQRINKSMENKIDTIENNVNKKLYEPYVDMEK